MAEQAPIIVKKKKGNGHAHHGGAWKVAYADFVTAMMALFMVLWIMGMDSNTRTMIAGYFNDPFGFVANAPKSEKLFTMPGNPASKASKKRGGQSDDAMSQDEESLKRMAAAMKRELGSEKDLQELLKSVEFTLTNDGLRIELVESAAAVFFENGEAKIRPNAMKLIQKIAPIIARSKRRIIVEGHTDARPYPSLHYTNWDLSTDRASSLRRALTSFGVPLNQFEQIRGYADTQPKVKDDPYHFSNRRVTLLLPFRPVNDTRIELPAEAFKQEIQGVFRKPVILAPNRPRGEGFEEMRPAETPAP